MQYLDATRLNGRSLLFAGLITAAALLLTHGQAQGQNATQATQSNVVQPAPYIRQVYYADELRLTVKAMAEELLQHLGAADNRHGALDEGLLVCTFVELKKLYRTSSFGRYLAEQLMSEFQQRDFRVVEMRKSQNVLVEERHGEYGLSRNPAEMRQEVAGGAMLTGTYVATAENIIVNARIMDNRSATLLSSTTMIFPRNSLAEELLADAATASTTPKAPLYLKRLEL